MSIRIPTDAHVSAARLLHQPCQRHPILRGRWDCCHHAQGPRDIGVRQRFLRVLIITVAIRAVSLHALMHRHCRRNAWESVKGTPKEECWAKYVEKLLEVCTLDAPYASRRFDTSITAAQGRGRRRTRQGARGGISLYIIPRKVPASRAVHDLSHVVSCIIYLPIVRKTITTKAWRIEVPLWRRYQYHVGAVQRCFAAADVGIGQVQRSFDKSAA